MKKQIPFIGLLAALIAGHSAAAAPPAEVSLTYSYLRANAPPGQCGCFSMNGVSGSYLYNLSDTLGVVVDAGEVQASNVRSSGLDLTLSSLHAGMRYTIRSGDGGLVSVFGQALVGVTRASGGLAAIASAGGGATTDVSAIVGAGLTVNAGSHFAIRALEIDYFHTKVPNGSNDYQNNLRASVGVVYRFGGP